MRHSTYLMLALQGKKRGGLMERRPSSLLYFVIYTSFLAVLLYSHASPAETREKWVARAVSVQGTVESQRVGDTQWYPVTLHDTYAPGDTIRVQERSRADI